MIQNATPDVFDWKCDQEIWSRGKLFLDIAEVDLHDLNVLCTRMNHEMEGSAKVDWSSFAGHALLRYIGDYQRVCQSYSNHIGWYNDQILQKRRSQYPNDPCMWNAISYSEKDLDPTDWSIG